MFKQDKIKELQLLKENYRGEMVMVIGGLVLAAGSLSIWYLLYKSGQINYTVFIKYTFITLIIGATGFLDDIAGSRDARGLRGHFSSLLKGKITTGLIKLIVITLTALVIVFKVDSFSLQEKLINSGIIILMGNFLNLLDLRPGRSIKFFLIVSFLFFYRADNWLYFFPYYLPLLPYLIYELEGRVMLGDAGANLLGFVLGYNLVNSIPGLVTRYIVFLSLFFLTLLSEKYSYTFIIENNRILKWLDNLGR